MHRTSRVWPASLDALFSACFRFCFFISSFCLFVRLLPSMFLRLALTKCQRQEHPSAEGVGHADGPLRLHEAADLHGNKPAHDVERREAHLKDNLHHVQAQVLCPAPRRCSCLVGRWDKHQYACVRRTLLKTWKTPPCRYVYICASSKWRLIHCGRAGPNRRRGSLPT